MMHGPINVRKFRPGGKVAIKLYSFLRIDLEVGEW